MKEVETAVEADRPSIEDRLGRHSDTDVEELPSARSSRTNSSEKELLPSIAERSPSQLLAHRLHLEVAVSTSSS